MAINVNNVLLMIYSNMLLLLSSIKEKFGQKVSKKDHVNGPLIIFVTVVGVIFIAWALGQLLCWSTTGTNFQWYSKGGKAWEFKLGCQ